VIPVERSAFDAWNVQWGSEDWVVPQEIWLVPNVVVTDRYLEGIELPYAELDAMREAALTITHSVHLDQRQLDFGRVGGRWYLLAMDVQDSGC
jgi:hypothetical protein